MTKVQIKNEVLAALTEHKANKKLTEALVELLEEYASKATKGSEKRDKVITIDGDEFVWCNRHEIYEPSYNFKTNKSDCCKLGHMVWANYGKQIKEAQEHLDALLTSEEFDIDGIRATNDKLVELKELRGGRYNFDDNALQFAEVESYNYSKDIFHNPDNV